MSRFLASADTARFSVSIFSSNGGDSRGLYVYYLGDFDRAGRDAADSLQDKLARFSLGKPFTVYWMQLAVAEEQIREMGLSTREPKRNTGADRNWPYDFACELDAIDANTLRDIVRCAIERHLPRHQFEVLKAAEASERELLRTFIDRYSDDDGDDNGDGDD
jgi:hypothetical protein